MLFTRNERFYKLSLLSMPVKYDSLDTIQLQAELNQQVKHLICFYKYPHPFQIRNQQHVPQVYQRYKVKVEQ